MVGWLGAVEEEALFEAELAAYKELK